MIIQFARTKLDAAGPAYHRLSEVLMSTFKDEEPTFDPKSMHPLQYMRSLPQLHTPSPAATLNNLHQTYHSLPAVKESRSPTTGSLIEGTPRKTPSNDNGWLNVLDIFKSSKIDSSSIARPFVYPTRNYRKEKSET